MVDNWQGQEVEAVLQRLPFSRTTIPVDVSPADSRLSDADLRTKCGIDTPEAARGLVLVSVDADLLPSSYPPGHEPKDPREEHLFIFTRGPADSTWAFVELAPDTERRGFGAIGPDGEPSPGTDLSLPDLRKVVATRKNRVAIRQQGKVVGHQAKEYGLRVGERIYMLFGYDTSPPVFQRPDKSTSAETRPIVAAQ